jgi:DNA-binding MarR family transcriptional regulator
MARSSAPADPEPLDLGLVDGVVQLTFSVHEILSSTAAEFDLSITQMRMLGVLRDRTPSMLELARFLSLEKSSVTGLVDRAEQRGLVARARGSADGRAVHVTLTAAGHAAAERLLHQVTARLAGLLETLTERERSQLAKSASRIVTSYAGEKGIDLTAGTG